MALENSDNPTLIATRTHIKLYNHDLASELNDTVSTTDVRRQKAVPSLTGIRGVTALWVALHHMQLPMAKLILLIIGSSTFLANGYRGVDLFFILSGFILMRSNGHEFTELKWRPAYRFGVARFFRIYPLNTVILLLMVPLVVLAPSFVTFSREYQGAHFAYKIHNLSWAGFVQSLLLVQTFTFAKLGDWNGPSWSLSAELLGYLLFPLLAFVLLRQRSALVCNLGALLCLVLLTCALVLGHHANNNPTGIFGAVRMMCCFTAGMLAYRAVELGHPRSPKVGSLMTVIAVGFIATTMFVSTLTVFDVFGFLLLIVGLVHKTGPIDWILRRRAFMWLGAISFSFYMIQETMFRIFLWAFGSALETVSTSVRLLAFGGMITSFLVIAWGLFLLVEKPSHRIGRRFSDQGSDCKPRGTRMLGGKEMAVNPTRAEL